MKKPQVSVFREGKAGISRTALPHGCASIDGVEHYVMFPNVDKIAEFLINEILLLVRTAFTDVS
jgi:hypothetical protein